MNKMVENHEISSAQSTEIRIIIPATMTKEKGIDDSLLNMSKFSLAFSQLLKEMVAKKILTEDTAGDIAYLVEDFIDGMDQLEDEYPDFAIRFDEEEEFDF